MRYANSMCFLFVCFGMEAVMNLNKKMKKIDKNDAIILFIRNILCTFAENY